MQYADGVTLITCTGDRPQAFERCKKFVGRQRWDECQWWQWVIVNDGNKPIYAADVEDASGLTRDQITIVCPEPKWSAGQNTLARNLLAAIPEVMYNRVLFAEDDDHISPDYVQRMAFLLDGGCSIVGDPNSLYYHLPSRKYRVMKNGASASLCQTGIRAELLPHLEAACKAGPDFIDYRLWQCAPTKLLTHVGGVVGIKGLPGRPGIGVGHYPEKQAQCWSDDTDLSVLRKWIGDDVSMYQEWL